MSTPFSLLQLGWRSFYSQQLTLEELDSCWPARVVGVHRSAITVLGERGESSVTLPGVLATEASPLTVGDWVMVENDAPRITRVLDRASLISRLSAGTGQRRQLIAANLDTLFVVTSCNDDFNSSRLERYLAVALDARVESVIVLTKADLCADVAPYIDEVARIAPTVSVLALNAMSSDATQSLAPWLGSGQSVAFVGSSGVGKSTLANTLSSAERMETGAIREDDANGRHTTTARQLIPMPGGAWLMDTPGMRELKVGAVEAGVSAVFTDVEALARACRFRDCKHRGDEGCALSAAVASGRIEERRVRSYLKLLREAANAARTEQERRALDRKFGRMHRALPDKRRRDGD